MMLQVLAQNLAKSISRKFAQPLVT